MAYHTILVAVVVQGHDRESAERALHDALPVPGVSNDIDSWWIAEDERYDRSDCDSAVFCGVGHQHKARDLIEKAGLA